MSCEVIRIKRARNGYVVCVNDPAIVEYNQKPNKTGSSSPWRDPEQEYVFDGKKALEAALDFISRIADKALTVNEDLPEDTFADAFDKAIEELGGDYGEDIGNGDSKRGTDMDRGKAKK